MSDCKFKCTCGKPVMITVTLNGTAIEASIDGPCMHGKRTPVVLESAHVARPDYSEAREAARKEQTLAQMQSPCVVLYEDRIQALCEQLLRRVVESPGVQVAVLLDEFSHARRDDVRVALSDLARQRLVVHSRLLVGDDSGTLHPTWDGLAVVEHQDLRR